MKNKLHDLVESSYKGCINKKEDVAEIVEKFINLPLSRFLDAVGPYM